MEVNEAGVIARLHEKILESPSSKIGEVYLCRLYSLLLSQPEVHLCFVGQEKGEVVAAITVTRDLHKTSKLFKRLFSAKVAFVILKAVMRGRVTMTELINRMRFDKSILKQFASPYPTILTLFVLEQYQRKGIGSRLVSEVMRRLKEEKLKMLYVDTLSHNTQAADFYKASGFKERQKVIDSIVFERRLN